MDKTTPAVPARIVQLATAFSQPEPIRRGSLYERRMKCGHPTCACQDDPRAAHGPYFTLTQKVGGKTRSRYIPPEQAPLVRQQIASGRQFRERVDLYWEACERWADEHLAAVPGSAEEAEKKGSRRTSKRQSPRKSRPLRPRGNGGASAGSDRDGRPTTGFTLGRARARTTAQSR
jgi:hypothetical protein